MAFSVDDFRTKGLRFGGARPNQFEVTINFPGAAIGTGINAPNPADAKAGDLRFLCRAASSPPSILEPAKAYYMGREINFQGDRVFPPWDITVYNDEDFALRNLFEKWSNSMNSLVGNRMSNSVWPLGYKVGATVKQFSKRGGEDQIIAQYEFSGMFPTTIDAMPLGWDMNNQIQEFGVQLVYDYWEPVSLASAANPYAEATRSSS